jgi:hypothetical protein
MDKYAHPAAGLFMGYFENTPLRPPYFVIYFRDNILLDKEVK